MKQRTKICLLEPFANESKRFAQWQAVRLSTFIYHPCNCDQVLFAEKVFGELSTIRNCVEPVSKRLRYLAFEMMDAAYFSIAFLLFLSVGTKQGEMKR